LHGLLNQEQNGVNIHVYRCTFNFIVAGRRLSARGDGLAKYSLSGGNDPDQVPPTT
jgi:hypothetical protein